MNKLILGFFFCVVSNVFAQDSLRIQKPLSSVPLHKWELGIDLLPLIDKSKDGFGFVVKRNFQTKDSVSRSAIRLKLTPQFLRNPARDADEQQSLIYLALGYERQQMFGHFSVLYGIEPFFKYNLNRIRAVLNDQVIAEQITNILGVSGFVGGRYYVGKHIALTLESHLIYQHNDSKGFTISTSSFYGQSHQLFTEPIHALYLSYHF